MHQQVNYMILMEAAAAYIEQEKPFIKCAEDARMLMLPILQDKEQEELWVIMLNTRNRVLGMQQVTVGLADRAQWHPREVFREAIKANACRIILVHNHPSGDPMPSPGDVGTTKSTVEAGKIIGIELADHVVLGKKTPERVKDFVSMRELGLV